MMGPRLGRLAFFAAQLGVLGATAAPTDSTLAFLYPNVLDRQKQRRRRRARRSDPASSLSSLLPTTRAASSILTTLPDIYTPGADGLWRKASGAAETCAVGDALAEKVYMQPTSTTGATSAASLEEFDTSTLPDGWKLQEPLARSSLIAIIGLSVALACAFVVLVLSLVSWRRRVKQDRDPERRRRPPKDSPPDDPLVVAATAHRKWLRAGVRWKDNVRLSARRRRSSSSTTASSAYRLSSPHPPSRHMTPSPSPTPRPPSSVPPPAPPHPPSSHPPAYHHERAPHYAPDAGAPVPGPSKPRLPTSTRDPHREVDFGPDGHVATDDKTLLAARAARASAPAPTHTRPSIPPPAAAPELDDELEMALFANRRRSLGIGGIDDLEEFGEDADASPSYVRHSPAVFPEPPRPFSQRASEKMRGEYAYAYGRCEGRGWPASTYPLPEGEMVPSAPPPELELVPSALSLAPSAPPEPSAPSGEDDFASVPAPSAPPELDDEPAHVPLPLSPTDSRFTH